MTTKRRENSPADLVKSIERIQAIKMKSLQNKIQFQVRTIHRIDGDTYKKRIQRRIVCNNT